MNVKLDLALLRPLLVPAIFVGVALAIWLVAIPGLIDRHDAIVGVETQLEAERQALQSQLTQRRNEVRDLTQFQSVYERLVKEGFTAPQNRLEAARTMERLGALHKLNTAKYAIAAEAVLNEPIYRPGDLETVSTTIELTMGAVLERNVVGFMLALQQALPGRVTLTDFRAEKALALSPEAELDDQRARQDFVRATATMQWRTVRQRPPGSAPRTGP